MKRWVIGLLLVAGVLMIFFYFFIPTKIELNPRVQMKASRPAISRLLIENNDWDKWWPVNDSAKGRMPGAMPAFTYNERSYHITDKKYNSVFISIVDHTDTIARTALNLIEIGQDSIMLDWEGLIPNKGQPLSRIRGYIKATDIKKDMQALLGKMEEFFTNKEKVYGIKINHEQVKDSTLISTYDSSKGYPSTELVYSLINDLKEYSASQAANVTGYPMLNIYTTDSIVYLTRVALPVDRKLPKKGRISYKWMLGGGNILYTDVTGDSKKVDQAFRQLDNFAKDYDHIPPAIPFFSLVTDRSAEKDSSRWVTRIYYPIRE
jgi:hypothetical protein